MREFGRILCNRVNLKCPACCEEPLFQSFFKIPEKCDNFSYVYKREASYFIEAIYINIGMTLLTVVLGYYAALGLFEPKLTSQIIFCGLFSTVFPIHFFRTTRGLWVNFDYHFTGKSDSYEHTDREIMKKGK